AGELRFAILSSPEGAIRNERVTAKCDRPYRRPERDGRSDPEHLRRDTFRCRENAGRLVCRDAKDPAGAEPDALFARVRDVRNVPVFSYTVKSGAAGGTKSKWPASWSVASKSLRRRESCRSDGRRLESGIRFGIGVTSRLATKFALAVC